MDANDTIAELLQYTSAEANLLLAVKEDSDYVLVWENTSPWHMLFLNKEQGDALAFVYPAELKTLNYVTCSVMQAALRKRYLDSILAELETTPN
jgi:hypothetical protein